MPALEGVTFSGPLGRFTWRMLATVLVGQAISVSLGALVARGIAVANGRGRPDVLLWLGLGLALLCLLAAGLMRGPAGLPLGWVCQALTLLTAFVVPMMLLVGLVFLALWVICMVQGARIETMVTAREAGSRHEEAGG